MKPFRNILFVGAAMVAISGTAQAACQNDVLASRNGEVLGMRSGAVYRILDNPGRAAFWLPLGRLVICEQVVVNVNGDLASIYEIRNQDGNDVVNAVRER